MGEKQVYTVAEVAALTGFSRNTIVRLFEGQRGVIILERPEKLHKRRYRSIRIPRAALEQVIGGITVRPERARS
jgi:hypothetical protein